MKKEQWWQCVPCKKGVFRAKVGICPRCGKDAVVYEGKPTYDDPWLWTSGGDWFLLWNGEHKFEEEPNAA